MNSISFAEAIALLGAALVGAAVAALLVHLQVRRRLQEMQTRAERAEKSRVHANELLLQARKQIEQLQKDVVMSRRIRPPAPAHGGEAKAAAPAAEPAAARRPLLSDDDPSGDTRVMPSHGFAETMPFTP